MEPQKINKGDRNKIYFLIIVIAALVGTNAYLFFKDRQQSKKFVTVSTEKDKLRLEVEKIEVELDKVNALNLDLNEKLVEEQQLARKKIEELKLALEKGEITQGELDKANTQISELKVFVKNYNDQIIQLQKDNIFLKNSRDSLENTLRNISNRASGLEDENASLSAKVKTAAALKLQNAEIFAFRTKSSGKKVQVSKSSAAEKLSVRFTIIPNELAEKGHHNIYLRVFDPAGNLLADDGDRFEADGQEMQFSHSIYIDYNNDNSSYVIDWKNPKSFMKGIYTVILYTNGNTMGKAQVELR
ncbi:MULTISPECIES: hypothetical protein [unclassified Pedobacter]|jgi:hypothetical protein|uniref:hypothetical protein n=1 Tax=Pedobacter TaxID=84567 RepID=UPI000B4B41D8|nr:MULTISPECIES: hypothetical protein [unclassified Pedobacter]MCX2431948.1 hypothetical protein [Pedobacter sp. GR22-10]MCX2582495.1 hypothetical protein [Pedobacter sp. MR22-3]OWK72641.1 hypothetical protein CBW18_03555 [Pedobacter sp. AJM]